MNSTLFLISVSGIACISSLCVSCWYGLCIILLCSGVGLYIIVVDVGMVTYRIDIYFTHLVEGECIE